MMQMPLTIGKIHFIGIGGIGMSGIAELLHELGYDISGSDINANANVKRLSDLGIKINIGHDKNNIDGVAVVVVSTAINHDNPEMLEAREQFIPVVKRAEMLAELMRLKWSISVAGTHGKTTTTSLVAQILETAEMDPTVINGGIINSYGTNARLGKGQWIVAEADESDGSFNKLPATIAIVTNLDPEHLDFWGNFGNLKAAFLSFIQNIPFYGFAIVCIDHPEIQTLIGKISDRRIITYGFSQQADIKASDIKSNANGCEFNITISMRGMEQRQIIGLRLPMHGEHNIQNSLAAIAVAIELGIDDDKIRQGLSDFSGVKRRFSKTGEVNGITIIDDYAHHPVEITAVLKAARTATRRNVIAVVQPHRYSRLMSLFEEFCSCFNDADSVIVTDVFAAGEDKIDGFDRDGMAQGLKDRGHRDVYPLQNKDELAQLINKIAQSGDLVICLGAGSISSWANNLPQQLQIIIDQSKGKD